MPRKPRLEQDRGGGLTPHLLLRGRRGKRSGARDGHRAGWRRGGMPPPPPPSPTTLLKGSEIGAHHGEYPCAPFTAEVLSTFSPCSLLGARVGRVLSATWFSALSVLAEPSQLARPPRAHHAECSFSLLFLKRGSPRERAVRCRWHLGP